MAPSQEEERASQVYHEIQQAVHAHFPWLQVQDNAFGRVVLDQFRQRERDFTAPLTQMVLRFIYQQWQDLDPDRQAANPQFFHTSPGSSSAYPAPYPSASSHIPQVLEASFDDGETFASATTRDDADNRPQPQSRSVLAPAATQQQSTQPQISTTRLEEAAKAYRSALMEQDFDLADAIKDSMADFDREAAIDIVAESFRRSRAAGYRLTEHLASIQRDSGEKRNRESSSSESLASTSAKANRPAAKKSRRGLEGILEDDDYFDSPHDDAFYQSYDETQDPFVYLGIQDQKAFTPDGKLRVDYRDELQKLRPEFLTTSGRLKNFFIKDQLPHGIKPPINDRKDYKFKCNEEDCSFKTRANRDFPAHYRWWHSVRTWVSEEKAFKAFIIYDIDYAKKEWYAREFVGGKEFSGPMVETMYKPQKTRKKSGANAQETDEESEASEKEQSTFVRADFDDIDQEDEGDTNFLPSDDFEEDVSEVEDGEVEGLLQDEHGHEKAGDDLAESGEDHSDDSADQPLEDEEERQDIDE